MRIDDEIYVHGYLDEIRQDKVIIRNDGGYFGTVVGELVEAIPKDNVYKAIQEMMKYEHEGFINISLARLDEILKKCEVSEDGNDTK